MPPAPALLACAVAITSKDQTRNLWRANTGDMKCILGGDRMSYIDGGTSGLHDVANWQGSRYAFVDPVLQMRWAIVHKDITEFGTTLAMNSYPVHGSQDLRTVHPTQGDPEHPEPFVQARIDKLNDGATKIADQIDAFERFARRRLGL